MDPKILELITQEEIRQQETLSLIPSENYCSKEVQKLVGSVLMNKYSEGYAGRRYYQGNTIIDSIENEAVERAKRLFKVPHANVQPYSGSPANLAVLFALCDPGDTILGMNLSSGGHLTHGHPSITASGRFYHSVQFGVNTSNSSMHNDAVDESANSSQGSSLIDYDAVGRLAQEARPHALIIGTTAYPMVLNWQRFAEIADSVGAFLIADISHVSGLILADSYPSPVDFAHVVMTTTHKTLRGPRGAMIMVTQKGLDKDAELITKIDRAVFPGLQGGPHNNTTAAIAQCLFEAETPEFKSYGQQVVANAHVMASELVAGGLTLVGGGTDCHLMLIDLRPQELSGNVVAEALEVAGIVTNRNSVPGDTSPFYPSGLRIGTPAVTTRGMKEGEMKQIASWILKVIDYIKDEKLPEDTKLRGTFVKEFKAKIAEDEFLLGIAQEVKELCQKYPLS
jgi:glycine hydroxymethyltransferase